MTSFERDPRFSAIAVTGGPGGGKSTFMRMAPAIIESMGFKVATLDEGATVFHNSGFRPGTGWRDPLGFNRGLFRRQMHDEELYYQMLKGQDTELNLLLMTDRGTKDIEPYAGEEGFSRIVLEEGYRRHHLLRRYKAVIHMVTAADGAPEHYTLDNNNARHETPEEAIELDRRTLAAWSAHPFLFVIDNSTGFEEKIQRAINCLQRVLTMNNIEPIEQERRFVVHAGTPPEGSSRVDIVQDYIYLSDSRERRVRKETDEEGTSIFFFTEKQRTDKPDERKEFNRQISEEEYINYLASRETWNPNPLTILKTRYRFVHAGRMNEHDFYSSPISIQTLEIEGLPMSEVVRVPEDYRMTEVTGRRLFSNSSIAMGTLPLGELAAMARAR